MSQTKASAIIKAFHDNDLFSSTLKAILENDDQLFLNAVKKANLTVEDLTLSDVEFDNLVKGIKPSGELDIATWEGYYEVDTGSDTEPYAFLILSTTESVYWGSRSRIMDGPGDCIVQHSLSSDGKLNFSTPTDGSVSITLTRTYDDTTGTMSVQVSGTRDEQSFFGSQVTPPLDSFSQTPADAKQTPLDLQRKTTKGAISISRRVDVESLLTWQDVCTIAGTAMAVFGFAVALYQVYLWIKESRAERVIRAQRVEQQLEDKVSLLEVVVEPRANTLDVNWDSAWGTLTNDITSRINEKLNNIDFNTQTPDQIVESLHQTARDAAVESLGNYVQHRIGSQILEMLDPFRSLPSYQRIKTDVTDEAVNEQIRPKLRDIGSDASTYDPLIRSLTLEARQRAFLDNYEQLSKAYNGAESAYEDARKKREGTEQDIKDVDRAIEEAQEAGNLEEQAREEERKRKLEEQLEELEKEEEEKEKARDEAQQAKNEAADQSQDADKDVNDDHSMDDWNDKGEGVFK
ncbi:hypothetical protein Clacol_003328 [Clathrus columnatus]|uniref:Uncharacterized protein n=1 Tax=Clathrus columnatus TaxID=1419009 RepID=A0AAV5A365_9AGAM|nr:hypothetical protein Clacol_003328 [Clathrus columnatus]